MTFWNGVFKLGILGFVVTVLFGLLTVATYAIGINEGPIAEGGDVSRYARLIGFWLFLAGGIALIVPSLADLNRSANKLGSAARIAWTMFILVFFFAAPYLYYGLYCRQQDQE